VHIVAAEQAVVHIAAAAQAVVHIAAAGQAAVRIAVAVAVLAVELPPGPTRSPDRTLLNHPAANRSFYRILP
jgi:hypothetical protein